MTFAVPSITNIYKESKLKTEEMFLNELSKSIDSYVTLNKDRTAIYAIYECNNDNLELMYGEGTYEIDGSKVTITDTYSNTLSITVNGNDTIDLNFDGIKQTLTK